MKYKLFGKSGLRVSEICLGAMTFGQEVEWGSDKNESKKIFNAFLDKGGNFIDTADIYQGGVSESFLGDFMEGVRQEIVLATKYVFSSNHENPNAGGAHRKNLIESIEGSLKRLKTEYVDILWVHRYDPYTPVEETMRALDDLISQGKVLYLGISDAPAWVVSKANTLAELNHWTPFTGLQIEYSLIERTPERELIDMASHFGMTVTPWSPLASGILTGKYNKSLNENRRLDTATFRQVNDRDLKIAETVLEVASELNVSAAAIAIRWLLQQGNNIIPIIGARTLHQLHDNLSVLDFEIPMEQLNRLNEVSKIQKGFPKAFLETSLPMMIGKKELDV